MVPLSEHEQHMLEQMERALVAEDPRFATSMRSGGAASYIRRGYLVAAIGVLAGLGLVLLGINTTTWVGVAGFVVMLASVAFAVADTTRAQRDKAVVGGQASSKAKPKRTSGFMDRLDERWDRRQGERY